MAVKHAFLGLLAQGPKHGYELKAAFENELVTTSPLNFGQVYSSLERLERDGLVAYDVVNQEERPDKKVYRLTESGRAELAAWLARPSAPSLDLRNDTFLKLAVARRLGDGDVAGIVAAERRACFSQLREVSEATRCSVQEGGSPEETLLLELAALRLESFLRWLDRCDELLT